MRCFFFNRREQNGITLLEILVLFAAVGVLAAVALPAYQDYIKAANVSKVNSQYESAVRSARSTFSKSNKQIGVELSTVPADAAEWVDVYNQSGVSAPNGGPAFSTDADPVTGAIGVSVDDNVVRLTIPEYEGLPSRIEELKFERRDGSRIQRIVHYATSRRPHTTLFEEPYYTGEWSEKTNFGSVIVNIPTDPERDSGELPVPGRFLLIFPEEEDPEKHFYIEELGELSKSDFYSQLQSSERPLLFIHGYRVKFQDAILRTAMLAYDLKRNGPAICFTWPSQGKTVQYTTDFNNNRKSVPQFSEFLSELKSRAGTEAIDVIVHSMGNELFGETLKQGLGEFPKFNQLVLAAPDIDKDIFRTQIAPAMLDYKPNRVTLYASSNDKALLASDRVFWNSPRLGFVDEDGIAIVQGIDSIDVSAVEGGWLGNLGLNHSAYGDELIGDIYYMLEHNLGPSDRAHARTSPDGKSWILSE